MGKRPIEGPDWRTQIDHLMNRISESAIFAAKAYESFKAMMSHMDEISKLTPLQFIEEVEALIGLDYKHGSYKRMLVDELVRRYEKAADIKRPEDEFPEPTEADFAEIEAIEKEMEAEKDKVLYWVIQFSDGTFRAADESGPDIRVDFRRAGRYPSQEAANEMAKKTIGATVVEVVP